MHSALSKTAGVGQVVAPPPPPPQAANQTSRPKETNHLSHLIDTSTPKPNPAVFYGRAASLAMAALYQRYEKMPGLQFQPARNEASGTTLPISVSQRTHSGEKNAGFPQIFLRGIGFTRGGTSGCTSSSNFATRYKKVEVDRAQLYMFPGWLCLTLSKGADVGVMTRPISTETPCGWQKSRFLGCFLDLAGHQWHVQPFGGKAMGSYSPRGYTI